MCFDNRKSRIFSITSAGLELYSLLSLVTAKNKEAMLRLTIFFCAFLFASAVIADDTTVSSMTAGYYKSVQRDHLDKISRMLEEAAESLLKNSTLPAQVSSNLNNAVTYERSKSQYDLRAFRAEVAHFEIMHPDQNVSHCIGMYNQVTRDIRHIFNTTFVCSLRKLQLYYIRNVYADIVRDIEVCAEEIAFLNAPLMTNRCYYNATQDVAASLRTSDELKLKMIKPDEEFLSSTLDFCKFIYKFNNMKLLLSTSTDRANKCIENARTNDTLLDRFNTFIFSFKHTLCETFSSTGYC